MYEIDVGRRDRRICMAAIYAEFAAPVKKAAEARR